MNEGTCLSSMDCKYGTCGGAGDGQGPCGGCCGCIGGCIAEGENQGRDEAVLADTIRAALIDPRTRAHTMQACDAYSIARHLLACGYGAAKEVMAAAWDEGWSAGAGWPQIEDNPHRSTK